MNGISRFALAHGIFYLENAALCDYTTFRIGGRVPLILHPRNDDQLLQILRFAKENGVRCRVFGRGSNLLADDEPPNVLLVTTREMTEWTQEGDLLRASAGVPLSALCRAAHSRGFVGCAGLFGIPGTVGAAIRINAGAFGNTVTEHLCDVTYYDATKDAVFTLPAAALGAGYRRSVFLSHPGRVILSARFSFPSGDVAAEREKTRAAALRRKLAQPLSLPSAGCVFRAPEGDSAGQLLDEAGCKGMCCGGARVSPKHANFIVNEGGATSRDVHLLIARVRRVVYERHGVFLTPEIERFPY